MAGSLEGPLAKWGRAKAGLDDLTAKVNTIWPAHKMWPVSALPDHTACEFRFYLGELPAIDPEWALDAGEILFNLRSALDHLAYELHVRRYRGRVPAPVEKVVQFPICDFPDQWKRAHGRVQNLSRRDRLALEQLQPFIGRDDRWSWHRYWLGRLNTWHNIDKHRRLHLISGAKNASVIPDPRPKFFEHADYIYGPVESGSHVETWTFSEPPGEIERHPGVFLHVAIASGDAEYDRLCDVSLYATTMRVREVIDRFSDRF